jgi:uroporphyrinogen decarboxylase
LIERVERLPEPDPNIDNVLAVLRREKPQRVPFLELKLDDEIYAAILDEPFQTCSANMSADQREKAIRQQVAVHHRLGFDTFRLRTGIPFDVVRNKSGDTAGLGRGERAWQNENEGPLATPEDLAQYRWPTIDEVEFAPLDEYLKVLPEGMAPLAYCSGVFEWSSWLMGLTPFMMALYENPDMVREIVDNVGGLVYQSFEYWSQFDEVPIFWLGDDLGFKTSTMIKPDHIREYLIPWYRKMTDLAHANNKPMIFHCCGNIDAVMNDLIDEAGFDALHSFEDVIEPVEQFYQKWHDRTAVVGGVDVDLLTRGSEEQVILRTQQILEACAPTGGYAGGSGNSVANYIPVDNYLAMIETIHRYNGRM